MRENQIPVKEVGSKNTSPSTPPRPKKIYVRASKGDFQRLRRYIGWLLMALFMLLPWIPYGERQAVLLDIGSRQFQFFGLTIWPQDFLLLAFLFIVAAFSLFFVTTFLGRVWCGYTCPQTVWTFIFIWFEEKIEGAANKRKKLDSLPWNREKITKKVAKHSCWIAFSLFTAMSFVAYFIPAPETFFGFFLGELSFTAYFWIAFFTLATYGNAGFLREMVCLHMCPYARFQSVMFDKDTYTVSYDATRGERRGPRSRKQDPKAAGLGDCIDCNVCVHVCPTGIDIRNGLQYECINCGACVDACNQMMAGMGYKENLISYTTERNLEGGRSHTLRPKLIGYGVVVMVMIAAFIATLYLRVPMDLDIIRDRNLLSRTTSEGLIENVYTVKILNKTQAVMGYTLSASGIEGLSWEGEQYVVVAPGEVYSAPITLAVDPYDLPQQIVTIRFTAVADDGETQMAQESRFIGEL